MRPGIVAFYSHINSTPGLSETPILNMVRVAAEMDPALRTKFETTAVINHFIMPPQSQYIRVWGQNQVRVPLCACATWQLPARVTRAPPPPPLPAAPLGACRRR